MSDRAKFWADDFDTDLLKCFPDAPKILHDPNRTLWTVGHTTHGRLNHPDTWNTHGAYLWTAKPALIRDAHGWFNVDGCVSASPELECTWLEWLRDAWVHSFGTIVLPNRRALPPPPRDAFMAIMYDLRGVFKKDVSPDRKRALQWITRCDAIMTEAA